MRYRILELLICIGILTMLYTQVNAQRVTQGEKAKMTTLSQLGGTSSSGLSGNGVWLTTSGEESYVGVLYNIKEDTSVIFQGTNLFGVSNNGKAVGTFRKELTDVRPMVYENGTWAELPNPGIRPNMDNSYYTCGISDDGSVISGWYWDKVEGLTCFVPVIWKDGSYKKLDILNFDKNTVNGGRPTGISGNGKFFPGFNTRTDPKYLNRVPVVFTEDNTSFELENARIYEGEVAESSNDGSIFVGGVGPKAVIWKDKKIHKEIEPAPGYTSGKITAVSENEIYIGYYQPGTSIGSRVAFVYTEKMGAIFLRDFLFELYGLKVSHDDLFVPMKISDNGLTMAGFRFIDGIRIPWIINFEEETLPTRPMEMSAKQVKGQMTVNLKWKTPYYCNREIQGYNVYRNGEKVNTELVTSLSFTENAVPAGVQEYTVTTVYANKEESKHSEASKIQIVSPDDCYSVKKIDATVVYNKHLTLHWSVPGAAIEGAAGVKYTNDFNPDQEPLNVKYFNENLDPVMVKDALSKEASSVIYYKGYYYVADYTYTGIRVLDEEWKELAPVRIPNLPGIYNMTTVGDRVFVVCGTKFVYEIDLQEGYILSQNPVSENARRITYIPTLDQGKGGFEIGDYQTSIFTDMSGKKIEDGCAVKNVMGSAYYKDILYYYISDGVNENATIEFYNATTKQPLNKTFRVNEVTEIKNTTSFTKVAGGLSLVVMPDSTIALGAMVQLVGVNNHIVFLELEGMPGLEGYNLYRNGEKVNNTPLSSRSYKADMDIPGKYTYYIKAIFKNGCESDTSKHVSVTIKPITGCDKVKDLKSKVLDGNVFLDWELPNQNAEGSLLGFTLHRDGSTLSDNFYTYVAYQDKKPGFGEHTYVVESFYDNSCRSFDTINVSVQDIGSCLPVATMGLSSTKNGEGYDVRAQWDKPYFEEPYPLSHSLGLVSDAMGLGDGSTFTVGMGWDSAMLETYKDYMVVGVEAYIQTLAEVLPIVIVNEKVVYYKDAKEKIKKEQYNSFMLDRPISLKEAKELVVGYSVKYQLGTAPVGMDISVAQPGYGDLITMSPNDPASWTNASSAIGTKNNWAVSALIVKARDISDKSASSAVYSVSSGSQPAAFKGVIGNASDLSISKEDFSTDINTVANTVSEPTKSSAYSAEDVLLQGFNIYRDDVKLNDELIKATEYSDYITEQKEYAYKVGAVYQSCGELESREFYIEVGNVDNESESSSDLKNLVYVYPNPTSGLVNIIGEYEKAEILDINGKCISVINKGISSYDMGSFVPGVYTIRFTVTGERNVYKKVVVK